MSWEKSFLDINALLNAYVGKEYGENPIENIDTIREAKKNECSTIANLVEIKDTDVLVDLGSGCGHMALGFVDKVKFIYCVDVNKDFLNFCKEEMKDKNNVGYHLIQYGDLTPLHNKDITLIYSTALSIHFHLYDVYHYLKACYDCLSKGGKFVFNFLDDNNLDINNLDFIKYASRYRKNRDIVSIMCHYNNPQVVKKIAYELGFSLINESYDVTNNLRFFVLEK